VKARAVSLDLRPETQFHAGSMKIQIFQAHFSLLGAKFLESLYLIGALSSQIFSHFLPNCGSHNIGKKDERCGALDRDISRGCIATSYLPLSDIAELQHMDTFCGNI